MCTKTVRPTSVRASVGSSASGSDARPIVSVPPLFTAAGSDEPAAAKATRAPLPIASTRTALRARTFTAFLQARGSSNPQLPTGAAPGRCSTPGSRSAQRFLDGLVQRQFLPALAPTLEPGVRPVHHPLLVPCAQVVPAGDWFARLLGFDRAPELACALELPSLGGGPGNRGDPEHAVPPSTDAMVERERREAPRFAELQIPAAQQKVTQEAEDDCFVPV